VQRELGTTVAIVTHNAPIAQMAHRAVSLRDGAIVSDVLSERRVAPSEIVW
jgi:putative ABC transport system ATP-binding protein